ncbi:zinc-ribbon and DUF3426 domain-containing protein [Piscinibacter koreensis]|uniref:DUF3426 domain-containing protein n=1 Tax=Piscinibacter koreensis TaxID=2742824 RepID=A0A7Y6TW64_9BURK|nr:zinc-ribbon and DUF3426 domain-containing protein [Schlegelella koreensis]NUZ05702.1 DUF3426 domain-containing protein [Schlegelella koreensis]
MSLATRCAFCGTAFRVVEDQLKVSDGWVRCGQCNQVFNGRAGLIELGAEPLPSDPSERGRTPFAPTPDVAESREASPGPTGAASPAPTRPHTSPDAKAVAPEATPGSRDDAVAAASTAVLGLTAGSGATSPEPLAEPGPFRIGLVDAPGPSADLGMAGESEALPSGTAPVDQADTTAPSMGALLARESTDVAQAPAARLPAPGETAQAGEALAGPDPSPQHPVTGSGGAEIPAHAASAASSLDEASVSTPAAPGSAGAALPARETAAPDQRPSDEADPASVVPAASFPASSAIEPDRAEPSGPGPHEPPALPPGDASRTAEPLPDSAHDTSPEIHVVFADPGHATPATTLASSQVGEGRVHADGDADAAEHWLVPASHAGSGELGERADQRERSHGDDSTGPGDRVERRDAASSIPAALESPEPVTTTESAAASPGDLPTFLQVPERPSRWQGRRARALLIAIVAAAALVLLGQIAHHFRDALAARVPATRGALEAWCGLVGCRVEAPRAIDQITLDSSALLRDPTLDAFRLSVTLRSRGTVALAMPSFDLRLTDSAGTLVARRMLTPRELGAPALLQPGSELALHALLAVREARVTGYTVEIFYP